MNRRSAAWPVGAVGACLLAWACQGPTRSEADAIRPPPPSSAVSSAVAGGAPPFARTRAALSTYVSPLFIPPDLVHVVGAGATCNPPLFANVAPNWPHQLRWVARAWDSRAMRGYVHKKKQGGGWEDFGREFGLDDPVPDDGSKGLPSCTGTSRSQKKQNSTILCTWAPTFQWAQLAAARIPYPKVDLLEPLADAARITDIVMVHDVLDYVLFKPIADCATLHTTGEPFGLSFPSRSAPLPAFPAGSASKPSTGAVDPGGQLKVLTLGGTQILDLGGMGGDPTKVLDLVGADGGAVPPGDRPERIGYSTVGHLLGANRTGLVRIHKKTGYVGRLMDWGDAPLPEFGPGGSAICCDIVHIADPQGGGAWLVAPAGRPEIWVLDDVSLKVKTKWTIGKVDGQPALAVRQLRAVLSTGWVWAVVQTAPEPGYDARIVLFRYPLWDGQTEIAPAGG